MKTVSPFEKYTDKYDQWFDHNRAVYESELKAVRHFMRTGDRGLEVGVGTGRFAVPLGIKKGIDPSPQMMAVAENRGINVIKGTGEDIPFGDEVFDFTLVVTTICFFDDPLEALKECCRVTRNGGYIVVGFVDRLSPLGETYVRKKQENVFYRHARFYSAEEVLDLLSRAGFRDFKNIQTVFGELTDITSEQDYCKGYGEGGFVVIKGYKKESQEGTQS